MRPQKYPLLKNPPISDQSWGRRSINITGATFLSFSCFLRSKISFITRLHLRHARSRKVVLTRWLSSAEAVRDTYAFIIFRSNGQCDPWWKGHSNQRLATGQLYVWLVELPTRRFTCIDWHECPIPIVTTVASFTVQNNYAAKSTLVNMVGTGATRIAPIGIDEFDVNTSFGTFSNKFIRENREGSVLRIHGTSSSPLRDDDVMMLCSWSESGTNFTHTAYGKLTLDSPQKIW